MPYNVNGNYYQVTPSGYCYFNDDGEDLKLQIFSIILILGSSFYCEAAHVHYRSADDDYTWHYNMNTCEYSCGRYFCATDSRHYRHH